MTDEFEIGSYWMSEQDDLVLLVDLKGPTVSYSYVSEPGALYDTSRPVFSFFFRRLEPEEEGLMLLQNL